MRTVDDRNQRYQSVEGEKAKGREITSSHCLLRVEAFTVYKKPAILHELDEPLNNMIL